ncbi:major histocompatibility complex class I-related gene protein-like [Puntigrus tetrazona]|uniref:major histocompatibility complex class I-related gene protein-like n=1 Tax=Puntigrus tetrazona TaxID=1606681 RepID=UPI001C8A39A2|nr:major histocompatibility complex class I-related gene protein-like [Puntigrus tetrazona]
MNFIFFIYITFGSFRTTYTRLNEDTAEGIPKIYSVSTLDGRQIDYYDNETEKLMPRQYWMEKFASGDKWNNYTEIRERVRQTSKQFSQLHSDYMYERVHGCVWDDETEDSHGFEEYSCDGKEFISLDLKENRYTPHVPQAEPTVLEWNNDRKRLDFLKRYYQHECTDWLKELLKFSKATFEETENQKILNGEDSKSSASDGSYGLVALITILVVVILILVYILGKNWNKLIPYCKSLMNYQTVPQT